MSKLNNLIYNYLFMFLITDMVMHSHASPCPSGELRCVDGRCITVQQICNGNKDCSDGADEANCPLPFT